MGSDEARRVVAVFDRGRLRTGRQLRSWSQIQLAREAGGLTPAAVSQFENGHARPSAATLVRIASSLQLPLNFFGRQPGSPETPPEAFFRSLRSTSAAQRRRSHARAILVHDLTQALEQYVSLPPVDIPPLLHPANPDAIEQAAAQTRAHFGLPAGPVENVVLTLERHGIIVARFRVDIDRVDAFSVPFADRPVTVLGADKGHRDRSRFDAAHELGHLVLHTAQDAGTKEAEAQAHQFAAAFLMPRRDIVHELPRRPDWDRLLALKAKWHVSLAALLKRANTLETLRPELYTQAMKTMSARRWRTQEPGDLGPPERPTLLARAVEVAAKNGTSLDKLAGDRGLPLTDIREMLAPSFDPRPRVTL